MKTQKIVNLLNYSDKEFSKFATRKCMSLMFKITQNMVKEMKMIQSLYLRQKLPNQIFVIIQMHIFL